MDNTLIIVGGSVSAALLVSTIIYLLVLVMRYNNHLNHYRRTVTVLSLYEFIQGSMLHFVSSVLNDVLKLPKEGEPVEYKLVLEGDDFKRLAKAYVDFVALNNEVRNNTTPPAALIPTEKMDALIDRAISWVADLSDDHLSARYKRNAISGLRTAQQIWPAGR